MDEGGQRPYLAAVDLGTTSIRCFLYDLQGKVVSEASDKIVLLYPRQGWSEIDPEEVWKKFLFVFRQALENINATASDVRVFGLATQRGTFTTWDKRTGKTFHNLVTWKDLRADHMVKSWNTSWSLSGIRFGSKFLHLITRNPRFLSGGNFKFMNGMVALRLRWMLDHNEQLRAAAEQGHAAMGTIDSFILHRLTLGKQHATDYSNVCVTGIYDPFKLQWMDWVMDLLAIPKSLLPEVRDSTGDWGSIDASLLGAEIPIRCIVSDQGASLFGSFCFQPGQVRLSMGTGSFLSLNTGSQVYASISGLYPIVGWKIKDEIVYVTEGFSSDTATVIEWCRSIGLFEKYEEISDLVTSVASSGELYFVPSFSGMQAPVNDEAAATGFIGMRPSTRKSHLLRAAVESLAFRVYQLHQLMTAEAKKMPDVIRVDGGVSHNDFLMQLIADLTNRSVERPTSIETAVHGAAFMAGLEGGVWASRDKLKSLYCTERVFAPDSSRWLEYGPLYSSWKKAVERFAHWY